MRLLCKILLLFNLIFTTFFIASCSSKKEMTLKVGTWKAELSSNRNVKIPFIFNVKSHEGIYSIEVINAEEKLLVDNLEFIGDSLKITMPFFDSEFMFSVYEDSLVGRWTKVYDTFKVEMPAKAYYNSKDRFLVKDKKVNPAFVGTWATTFYSEDKTDSTYAVAEFRMVDNKIYGTFLTSSGDYRFLEGLTDGNKLHLSTFDGSHAYYFYAELTNGNTEFVNGKFYSGLNSFESWKAKFDISARLPDADSLTFLKDGYDKIDFKFKNIEGKEISLNDDAYKNKVVLVQILGSWCPNCMDETNYLVPYYREMKNAGLEIIGLCYERSEDVQVATKNIANLKRRLDIPYQLLIAGTNKKGNVNQTLPMLKNFIGYPTLIIIDKKGKVRKIHTGYSGPATGKHYVEFKSEFESFINLLLAEK